MEGNNSLACRMAAVSSLCLASTIFIINNNRTKNNNNKLVNKLVVCRERESEAFGMLHSYSYANLNLFIACLSNETSINYYLTEMLSIFLY